MGVHYDSRTDSLRVSVHDLTAGRLTARPAGGRSNRLTVGQQAHRLHADRRATQHGGYQSEVPLAVELDLDGATVTLRGRADGCWPTPRGTVIEEVKLHPRGTVTLPLSGDISQLQAYLWLWSQQADVPLPSHGELSYIDPWRDRAFSHTVAWSASQGDEAGQRIISRLRQILAWERAEVERLARRAARASHLRWPFDGFRDGQEEMGDAVRSAITDRRHLCLEAPTGAGKTAPLILAALEETVRRRSRLLILTSRRSQQDDRLDLLQSLGPPQALGRVLLLGSQERLGDSLELATTDEDAGSDSESDQPAGFVPWCDPWAPPEWLLALWDSGEPLHPDQVRDAARAHNITPASLQRQLATMADVVVCDMNYLLMPRGLPPAWLLPSKGKRPVVALVDEAHGLPDRARNLAAAGISLEDLATLADWLEFSADRNAEHALLPLDQLARAISDLRDQAEEQGPGLRLLEADDPTLLEPLERLLASLGDLDNRRRDPRVLDLVGQLQAAWARGQDAPHSACYFDPAHASVHWELMAPSALLIPRWDALRTVVCFSATLTPWPLFLAEVGLPPDRTDCISFAPVTDSDRQRVVRYGAIATTYHQRQETACDLVELLLTCAASSDKPWLVFFPSRAYLELLRVQLVMHEVTVTHLTPGMPAKLLRLLDSGDRPSLHLTVLGGAFAEGFDPDPDTYAGAVIVSLGLAPPNARSELQRLFTDSELEHPQAQALIPALRRVRQAAGRVFRSPEQRGTLLLVDQRWADPDLEPLLPDAWVAAPLAMSLDELGELLT